MRRLRDVGIVTMLLLGLTGCAGVQQRLGLTEPPYRGDDDSEERPLSRLAFWRRHRAEEAAPSSSSKDSADPGRSTMIAGNGTTSGDDDEDRPGLLRRLPLLGRLWKDRDLGESDPIDIGASRYASPKANAGSIASLSRRPTGNATASPTAVADAAAAAAPLPAQTTASAEPDRPEGEPSRDLTVDLAGVKPQVDASAVPAAHDAPPPDTEMPPPLNPAPGPAPSPMDAAPQQADTPPPPVVPSRVPASATPTAIPGAAPESAPDLSPVTNRGPALPSPAIGAGDAPASGSWTTPTVTSGPGPVWPMTATMAAQPTYDLGSGQSVVTTSPQEGYVSGGCEPTCGPKCKVHKLCPFKKHKQTVYASSQYSPVPSAQGVSCEGTCKVKKPCFLKTWLHHKSGCKLKGCKGCKSCSYCGENATYASAPSVVSSQQW